MERKKLGDFCKLRQGFQVPLPNQETELKDGYVRFIRIVDYTQETNDIRYVKDSEKFYHVKPDDVVMVRYGAAGEVGHGISGVIANNMFLIDPLININKDYLYYYLAQNKIRLKLLASSTSTTMPALNFKIVNDLQVPLYERDKQDEIVAILDKLSSVIEKRKNEITALDELIKARFVELFGETETNPCKWPVAKLSEFCDLQNGYAFKSQDYLDNSSVLNCRMSNIRPDGGFDAEYHPKYLPDTFWEQYREYRLVDGDVIIAMTDMASDPKILGVPTIVRTNGKKFLLNQRVGKLTFYDNKAINNVYLMFVLSQKHIRQQLVKSAGGSTQINVGKPAVLGVEFLVPPMELQKQFAAFVEQTNKSKVVVQKALDEAHLLFDSLMQEYFE